MDATRKPLCSAPGCWTPSYQAPGDVPLCSPHLKRLRVSLGLPPTTAQEALSMPMVPCHSIVYYLTLDGGSTVKIGTTANPPQRFSALAKHATAEPELLVAHPGSYKEERIIHYRFRRYIADRNEYFLLVPQIVEHVDAMRIEWPHWRRIVEELGVSQAKPRKRKSSEAA